MAVKGILFNTEMVRAILDGRKSCTRRIVKPQPEGYFEVSEEPLYIYDTDGNQGKITPPYQPGDIIYVRETWHKYIKRVGEGQNCHLAEFYGYKASVENSEDAGEPWKPSIHMPKEAARIWLKVTDVRVERLQEITADDIRNEGLSSAAVHCGDMEIALKEWENLWNSTIKKSDLGRYDWNASPWVWVIEFERCEKMQEEHK